MLFSLVVVPFYIPTNSAGEPPVLHPSLAFIVRRFVNDGRSDGYKVIPQCGFDLRFSNKQ